VGRQAAIAAQPRKRAFDHPAPANDLEATVLVGALDDFDRHFLTREIGFERAARVTAVRKDMTDEGEGAPCRTNEIGGAIAILHACRQHVDAKEQTYRVDDDIALDAFRLFAGVVADRIDARPPFSVALTACVSMIAAVGEASRPSCSRAKAKSA